MYGALNSAFFCMYGDKAIDKGGVIGSMRGKSVFSSIRPAPPRHYDDVSIADAGAKKGKAIYPTAFNCGLHAGKQTGLGCPAARGGVIFC